ncbi:hypothetical protein, partial [uncultured Rikenella sp.]|uniref:hypothetical protein n=1 Tax=uncultured Rikenella sp. TaxID=368003 RepID=UPI00262BB9D1
LFLFKNLSSNHGTNTHPSSNHWDEATTLVKAVGSFRMRQHPSKVFFGSFCEQKEQFQPGQ